MFRKIIVLIISVFIGIVVTSFSVTKLKIEGIQWFAPRQPDIQPPCGDHWAGLPFAIVYTKIDQEEVDRNVIRVPWMCHQEISYLAMFLDLFIWTFAVYVGIESAVRQIKSKKSQR